MAQLKKNKRIIETDHNGEILELDIKVEKKVPAREEIFNMKNKECQEAFKVETDTNAELLEDLPFEIQCKRLFKAFNNILHKCFKKKLE